MTAWSSRVIAGLRAEKDSGATDFDSAWLRVTRMTPPDNRDRGEMRPVLFDASLPVLEEPAESMVDFVRRVCEDCWYDRRPVLQHLSVDLLHAEPVDEPLSRKVA